MTSKNGRVMQTRILNHNKIQVIWDSIPVEYHGKNVLTSITIKYKKRKNYLRNPKPRFFNYRDIAQSILNFPFFIH
jgi:thioredoxin reductase